MPAPWGPNGDVMRRPKQTPTEALSLSERKELASRARYVGSCEHKDRRWWGGQPGAGARRGRVTTICPLTSEEDQLKATMWVQRAICAGQYKFVRNEGPFPRYVWYEEASGQLWKGRCFNPTSGEYKGWPIKEEEWRETFR